MLMSKWIDALLPPESESFTSEETIDVVANHGVRKTLFMQLAQLIRLRDRCC